MSNGIFILVIIILSLASCNNNHTQDKSKIETPKALEDKNSSYDLISKRRYDDIVESLYDELVSKDIDLKNIEDKINALNHSKSDTTELFENFNAKNQSYFNSANRHLSEINDSLVKNTIKNLITLQLTKYDSKISKHKELLKLIEAKQITIADLHIVLKIVRTLPLIDKFQNENLPNIKSLESYIHQQNETIKQIDTLSKQ